MANENVEKQVIAGSKSFMSVGPMLRYSHANVHLFWGLGVVSFAITCFFWSKITTGSFYSFFGNCLANFDMCFLRNILFRPINIFEYPYQIFVLGLLMAVLGVIPPLVSQLLSFRYSIPFIILIGSVGCMPLFAGAVLLSCAACACRPLRFRSRIVAIALCMAPQFLYWGYFGGAEGVEPIKWGFSFAPWVVAGVCGLLIAAIVLGIGHFTRYRPGLIWAVTIAASLGAFLIFEYNIGLGELDYQLYVARNNPEEDSVFHDHKITKALDRTITDPTVKRYLSGFFYPTEPILLREELKREILTQLGNDRWPSWLIVPDELSYQKEKERLFGQYDLFISSRGKSERMPIALYYKALLEEYRPDLRNLGENEVLSFYSDHPNRDALPTWYRLYQNFGNSPESIEARWRIAMHLSGQGMFDNASGLCMEAKQRIKILLDDVTDGGSRVNSDSFFTAFGSPAKTVMTRLKLRSLLHRVELLNDVINLQNHGDDDKSIRRLSVFVMLNPYSSDYSNRLDELLAGMGEDDKLIDNVLVAKTMLIKDSQRRSSELKALWEKFKERDGGVRALYEYAVLQVSIYKGISEKDSEERKEYLVRSYKALNEFMSLYPESIFFENVDSLLKTLPRAEER